MLGRETRYPSPLLAVGPPISVFKSGWGYDFTNLSCQSLVKILRCATVQSKCELDISTKLRWEDATQWRCKMSIVIHLNNSAGSRVGLLRFALYYHHFIFSQLKLYIWLDQSIDHYSINQSINLVLLNPIVNNNSLTHLLPQYSSNARVDHQFI